MELRSLGYSGIIRTKSTQVAMRGFVRLYALIEIVYSMYSRGYKIEIKSVLCDGSRCDEWCSL
jgi:hypothetical protein